MARSAATGAGHHSAPPATRRVATSGAACTHAHPRSSGHSGLSQRGSPRASTRRSGRHCPRAPRKRLVEAREQHSLDRTAEGQPGAGRPTRPVGCVNPVSPPTVSDVVWVHKTRCAPKKSAGCRQDANFGTPTPVALARIGADPADRRLRHDRPVERLLRMRARHALADDLARELEPEALRTRGRSSSSAPAVVARPRHPREVLSKTR